MLSDGEVIQASIADPPRFAPIFDNYYPEIFRYAERRVGYDQAADVASEVFAQAFSRRHTFRGDATSARPWLYGIAATLTMKERRRFARHLAAGDRLGSDRSVKPVEAAMDEWEDASELADRFIVVRAALERLDETTRELLLMVAWDGLSYEQAAEALQIPIGTVRSRISRGRARLATLVRSATQTDAGSRATHDTGGH